MSEDKNTELQKAKAERDELAAKMAAIDEAIDKFRGFRGTVCEEEHYDAMIATIETLPSRSAAILRVVEAAKELMKKDDPEISRRAASAIMDGNLEEAKEINLPSVEHFWIAWTEIESSVEALQALEKEPHNG